MSKSKKTLLLTVNDLTYGLTVGSFRAAPMFEEPDLSNASVTSAYSAASHGHEYTSEHLKKVSDQPDMTQYPPVRRGLSVVRVSVYMNEGEDQIFV